MAHPIADELNRLNEVARAGGLLALRREQRQHELLALGLDLVVGGTPPERLRAAMQQRAAAFGAEDAERRTLEAIIAGVLALQAGPPDAVAARVAEAFG